MPKLLREIKVEDLLKPRAKCIADFPSNPFKIGQVIEFFMDASYIEDPNDDILSKPWISDDKGNQSDGHGIQRFTKYPHLFKMLRWYEDRTIDEMMSVEFVKITEYTGYWRVGDIVPVTDYKVNTRTKTVELYILGGSQQSLPERCEPATKSQYEDWKRKNRR